MSGRLPRALGVLVILVAVAGGITGFAMSGSVYREFQSYGRLLEVVSVGIGLSGLRLLFPQLSACIFWLVGGILCTLMFLRLESSFFAHTIANKSVCKMNLHQIGRAIYLYEDRNEGTMPYDERSPLHSLALLYSEYCPDPRTFQCPTVRSSWAKRHLGAEFPVDSARSGERCHYGYTWRCAPDAPPDFAIAADMPENHVEGYNVLYMDGAVKWQKTPFCSHDPNDNIFAREPGWSPDTDSFIRLK